MPSSLRIFVPLSTMPLQNLFVTKLPRNLGDTDLADIFAEFHPSNAKVMLDAQTGLSKGFGFVFFEKEENAKNAFSSLNRRVVESRKHRFTIAIYPSNYDGKSCTQESTALYIRNLPISMTRDQVNEFLSQFGNLTYFAIRHDHYGTSSWVAYAQYKTIEEARNALQKLHGNSNYFPGSVAILAKFEDTNDAKQERQRRRKNTPHQAPPSRCIFPPPRRKDEASSLSPTQQPLAASHGDPTAAAVPLQSATGAAVEMASQHYFSSSNTSDAKVVENSPPPYSALNSMPFRPDSGAAAVAPFSPYMSPPPHDYCYNVGLNVPSSLLSMPSFNAAMQVNHFTPQVAPSSASQHLSSGLTSMPLLTPQQQATVVLSNGSQQYVWTANAVNASKLSASNGSQTSFCLHSPSASSVTGSSPVSYTGTNLYLQSLPPSFGGTTCDTIGAGVSPLTVIPFCPN